MRASNVWTLCLTTAVATLAPYLALGPRRALAGPGDGPTLPVTGLPLGELPESEIDNGILTLGDSEPLVLTLQKNLNAFDRIPRNLPPIAEDGSFGPATAQAVADYQALVGLPVTGVGDFVTQGSLDPVSKPTTLTSDTLGVAQAPRTTLDDFTSAADGKSPVIVHTLPQGVTVTPPKPLASETIRPYAFVAGMKLDLDGSGKLGASVPGTKSTTTLLWGDDSLDTAGSPWVTLPASFAEAFPGTRPGDVVAVIHSGRVAYAQVANVAGDGQLGEGSVMLARQFPDLVSGPNHDGKGLDPTTGGDSNLDVTYVVFPGSGDGTMRPNQDVVCDGTKLLAQLAPKAPSSTPGIAGAIGAATDSP